MHNKYKGTTLISPVTQPVRTSAIDEELSLQITCVDKLHALLDTLCERINPVLRPPVPTVDEKDCKLTEASPCANRLAASNGRLNDAIRKLNDMLERCDL